MVPDRPGELNSRWKCTMLTSVDSDDGNAAVKELKDAAKVLHTRWA